MHFSHSIAKMEGEVQLRYFCKSFLKLIGIFKSKVVLMVCVCVCVDNKTHNLFLAPESKRNPFFSCIPTIFGMTAFLVWRSQVERACLFIAKWMKIVLLNTLSTLKFITVPITYYNRSLLVLFLVLFKQACMSR